MVFVEDQKILEAAMTTDPKTREALQKLVRKAILEARRDVVNNIHFDNGDPKNTRQAVRTTVYRKILGANINIRNSKKKHGVNTYVTPRHSQGYNRGGNRMKRSRRTQQILSYSGLDRGFIMRFVDSGTKQRFVGFRNERKANRNRYIETKRNWDAGGTGLGNRGRIVGRNFFYQLGMNALEIATGRLAELIETELTNTLEKKK